MDMVEIIEDISEHIPEALYLNLFNKLKECKDMKEEVSHENILLQVRRSRLLNETSTRLLNSTTEMSEAYQRQLAERNLTIHVDPMSGNWYIPTSQFLKNDDMVSAEWKNTGRYFKGKIVGLPTGSPILPKNWPIKFGNQKYTVRFYNREIQHDIQRERILFIKTPSEPPQSPPAARVRNPWESYFTIPQLKEYCRNNGIKGYSVHNKQGIQNLIKDHVDALQALNNV